MRPSVFFFFASQWVLKVSPRLVSSGLFDPPTAETRLCGIVLHGISCTVCVLYVLSVCAWSCLRVCGLPSLGVLVSAMFGSPCTVCVLYPLSCDMLPLPFGIVVNAAFRMYMGAFRHFAGLPWNCPGSFRFAVYHLPACLLFYGRVLSCLSRPCPVLRCLVWYCIVCNVASCIVCLPGQSGQRQCSARHI